MSSHVPNFHYAAFGLSCAYALLFAGGAMLVLLIAAYNWSLNAVPGYFEQAFPGRNAWLLGGARWWHSWFQ
jgi:hypothetical protein